MRKYPNDGYDDSYKSEPIDLSWYHPGTGERLTAEEREVIQAEKAKKTFVRFGKR